MCFKCFQEDKENKGEDYAGCSICIGGTSGVTNDLVKTFDSRLISSLRLRFTTFADELAALIVGICVATIANVALGFFVLQNISDNEGELKNRADRTFTSMVTLVSVSAASSDANPGSVQTLLAGILSGVQFVAGNSSSEINANLESFVVPGNETIPTMNFCSASQPSTGDEVTRAITSILILTFTALMGRLLNNSYVMYLQCSVVGGVNLYIQYSHLCHIGRSETNIVVDLWVNIGLLIIAIVFASFGSAVKILMARMVRLNSKKLNGTHRNIYSQIKRIASHMAASTEIVSITGCVTVTSFAVFCTNVYLLTGSSIFSAGKEELSIFLTPSITVVARSVGLMTSAYQLYYLSTALTEIEMYLQWQYDTVVFVPKPIQQSVSISGILCCYVPLFVPTPNEQKENTSSTSRNSNASNNNSIPKVFRSPISWLISHGSRLISYCLQKIPFDFRPKNPTIRDSSDAQPADTAEERDGEEQKQPGTNNPSTQKTDENPSTQKTDENNSQITSVFGNANFDNGFSIVSCQLQEHIECAEKHKHVEPNGDTCDTSCMVDHTMYIDLFEDISRRALKLSQTDEVHSDIKEDEARTKPEVSVDNDRSVESQRSTHGIDATGMEVFTQVYEFKLSVYAKFGENLVRAYTTKSRADFKETLVRLTRITTGLELKELSCIELKEYRKSLEEEVLRIAEIEEQHKNITELLKKAEELKEKQQTDGSNQNPATSQIDKII